MLEIAETTVIAQQMNELIKGKTIKEVIVGESSHKFAWYYEPVENYDTLLSGNQIIEANSLGSMIEVRLKDDVIMILGEGEEISYFSPNGKIPTKHQLLILFDDDSGFIVRIKLYGWVLVGTFSHLYHDILYYRLAKDRPNVLSKKFTYDYFMHQVIMNHQKESIKAALSTKQNIPGLGNGTLQDILWMAKIHPKTKVSSLGESTMKNLYDIIVKVVSAMVSNNGRSSENTFLGEIGGYQTSMSSQNQVCPICHSNIMHENYLGGKVHFCNQCQSLAK